MKLTNLVKNAAVGETATLCKLLLQFAVRTVFIRQLSVEYLGANDLFATIVSILSIGRMGVGSAMKYAMYRPFAGGDQRGVKAVANLYQKTYEIIGGVLMVIGLMVYPILLLARPGDMGLPQIGTAYLFLLLDMGAYYLFDSRRAVLIANQTEYLYTTGETVAVLLQSVLQIFVLLRLHSFTLYFVAKLTGSLCLGLWSWTMTQRKHPFLRRREKIPLAPAMKEEIKLNVKANILNTIGETMTDNVDYVLMFFVGGLSKVGLLTNYNVIINSVSQLLWPLFQSALGTVGHLDATAEKAEMKKHFQTYQMMAFWLFGAGGICLLFLMNPFVSLWAGEEYLVSFWTVLVMVLVFFSRGMRCVVDVFRDGMGLFWHNRYRMIVESTINVLLSVILVNELGIIGLFLGTLLSDLLVTFWLNPYNLYKYGFGEKVGGYFLRYGRYFVVLSVAGLLTGFLCAQTQSLPVLAGFAAKTGICVTIPNLLFFIFFRKTPEFCFLCKYIKNIFVGNRHPQEK